MFIKAQKNQVTLIEAEKAAIYADTLQQISNFKHHSVYAELFGNSFFFYSVNYDYLLKIYRDNIKLAIGTGIGYYPVSYLDSHGHKTPIEHYIYLIPEANFLFGKKSHYLEVGTSLMVAATFKNIELKPNGRIGYRYQPQKGGFLFRAAYTPILNGNGWFGYHWAGISFGYIF
jgi:hypothetical protein